MDNVGRNLKILRGLILFVGILIFVVHSALWIAPEAVSGFIPHNDTLIQYGGIEALSSLQFHSAMLIIILPAMLLSFSLYCIYQLTSNIQQGLWFSDSTEDLCYRLAKSLLFYTFVKILHQTLLVLVLTMNNPEGTRELVFKLSSDEIVILIPAFLAMLAAQMVHKARQTSDELEQIV